MKTKKVNRYYCEFCKKANCSASSISTHEKSCTLNPNRFCGMCAKLDLPQAKMDDLLAILPKPEIQEDGMWGSSISNIEHVEKSMAELRGLSNNCPACIMATIRQKGFPVPAIESFNFTKECEKLWTDYNNAQFRSSDYANW